jgi:hypothetical protein
MDKEGDASLFISSDSSTLEPSISSSDSSTLATSSANAASTTTVHSESSAFERSESPAFDWSGGSPPGRPSTPPANSSSPPSPPLTPLNLGSHLRNRINSLTPRKRASEITRLQRVSQYERDRENNVLRNESLLSACGFSEGDRPVQSKAPRPGKKSKAAKDSDSFEPEALDTGASSPGSPVPCPTRPRRLTCFTTTTNVAVIDEPADGENESQPDMDLPQDGQGEVEKGDGPVGENQNAGEVVGQVLDEVAEKETRGENGVEFEDTQVVDSAGKVPTGDTEDEANDEDEDDEGEEDELRDELEKEVGAPLGSDLSVIAPPQGTPVNLSLAPAVIVDRDGWPQWLADWYAVFMGKGFGTLWTALVARWTVVERGHNWASPVSSYLYITVGSTNYPMLPL